MRLLPTTITTLVVTLPLSFLALAGTAQAQNFSNDVVAHCAQAVAPMKFEGWPADRNREMMMLACESNGGHIPGMPQGSPVSLSRHHAAAAH